MSVFDDSFVILGDDASESVPVSAYDGSVHVDDSTDDVFAAPSSDYGGYSNGADVYGSSGGHDGPILPPPSEMESDEGAALREWRRLDLLVDLKVDCFARCSPQSLYLLVACDHMYRSNLYVLCVDRMQFNLRRRRREKRSCGTKSLRKLTSSKRSSIRRGS